MNKFIVLIIILLLRAPNSFSQQIIKAEQLYNLNDADSIDKIIQAEASNLDSLIMPTSVWLSDQVATQFDPTFGVILNKKYILKLAEDNHFADLKNLFRLILSHEKMHALQTMRLTAIGRSLQSLSREEEQVLECQADMCAGYLYLFPIGKQYAELLLKDFLYSYRKVPQIEKVNRFPAPVFSSLDSLLTTTSVRRNIEGLQLFFSIGEYEGVFGSHPNPYSRKTSFEMGVNAFHFLAMQQPIAPGVRNKISPEEWQYLNAMYNALVATLGVVPQDFQAQGFFEVWSQRIAKKIIHLLNKAARNILFTIKESRWDTSTRNPLLYFKMDAKNSNSDSMMIDMDIMTKLVPRKNADDPLKSRIAIAKHYLFILPPNGTHSIQDSILWLPGTDSTMPSVSYPGEEGSLYTVFPTNIKVASAYALPTVAPQLNPALNDPVVINEKLIRRLPLVQREFNSMDADYFKNGAGLLWGKSGEVKYCAYIGREQFSLHIPLASGEKPFLSKEIGVYETFSKALLFYNDLKKDLLELGNGYNIEELKNEDNSRYAEVLNPDKNRIYSLRIIKEYLTYKLTLEIFKE